MNRRTKLAKRRVYLEAPALRYKDEFLAAVRRSRRLHDSWVSPPATPADYARFLARAKERTRRTFLIRLRDTDELVGVATLGDIIFGNFRGAFVGYYAFEPFARKGYLSEGLSLVLDVAFGTLRLNRVEANVQPRNLRSLRLVRSLGFRREGFSPKYLAIAGRFRDHVRTAILASEWRKLRRRAR